MKIMKMYMCEMMKMWWRCTCVRWWCDKHVWCWCADHVWCDDAMRWWCDVMWETCVRPMWWSCMMRWCDEMMMEAAAGGGGEGGGGGGGGRAAGWRQKTRTPHGDVGTKQNLKIFFLIWIYESKIVFSFKFLFFKDFLWSILWFLCRRKISSKNHKIFKKLQNIHLTPQKIH